MSDKRYISYFQSVITIGLLSSSKSVEEAEKKSSSKFLTHDGVNHCFFDQTPFKLSETEEWTEDFEYGEGEGFRFDPDEKTRGVIATRLQKLPSDLTQDDIDQFLKDSILSVDSQK